MSDPLTKCRRVLLKEWVRIGWHLDGMPWTDYLKLSIQERIILHETLSDLIEETNPDGPRPKDMRRGTI